MRYPVTVINKIDREDAIIDGLNGILWYNLTVSDNANNSRTEEVKVIFKEEQNEKKAKI